MSSASMQPPQFDPDNEHIRDFIALILMLIGGGWLVVQALLAAKP